MGEGKGGIGGRERYDWTYWIHEMYGYIKGWITTIKHIRLLLYMIYEIWAPLIAYIIIDFAVADYIT